MIKTSLPPWQHPTATLLPLTHYTPVSKAPGDMRVHTLTRPYQSGQWGSNGEHQHPAGLYTISSGSPEMLTGYFLSCEETPDVVSKA